MPALMERVIAGTGIYSVLNYASSPWARFEAITNMPKNSVDRDGLKLGFIFPPPAAPAAPHVKR